MVLNGSHERGCDDSGVDNDHDHVIIFFQRHSTILGTRFINLSAAQWTT